MTRRIKLIRLDWLLLDDLLKGNLRPPVYMSNLPETAQITSMRADRTCQTLILTVEDKTFELLAEGDVVPMFALKFTPARLLSSPQPSQVPPQEK